MTGFAPQHEYRIGRALVLAFLLVVLGSWLFPVGWLRVFGRPMELETAEISFPSLEIRLIPVPEVESAGNSVPIRTSPESVDSPEADDFAGDTRYEWAFDPTTAWQPLSGSTEPLAGAIPDSVLLRADLLNALRLANWGAIFAMLDTTQTGRAHEQLAETDDWIHAIYAPMWTAQGHARRQSNLWYRVVGEVEKEGSQ